MRFQAAILMGAFFFTGCVGPGQHVRGGHSFHHSSHHSRHHGGLDGLFAILEGVALIADIAESASASSAYERAARPPAPPPPPPPPPPERVQVHWLKGTLVLRDAPNTWLPEMPIALKATNREDTAILAYSGCNHAGQFSFPLPPAGNYELEVVDPYYEGETVFTTDGVSDVFLLVSITARPM
jgi:hypothetical protein